jgi:hypothetical protein
MLVHKQIQPILLDVAHVIHWDILEILPIAEDQIGIAITLMGEDAIYELFLLVLEQKMREQRKQGLQPKNKLQCYCSFGDGRTRGSITCW